jgi:hypothetical protein
MTDKLTALASALDWAVGVEGMLAQRPQIALAAKHLVHGGLYARTVHIPAGTMLTGAMLNSDNICIVCGDITVTSGAEVVRLTGYHTIPACAGQKRVGFAHSDTWWTTLVATDSTDISAIEDAATSESDRLQTRQVELPNQEAACLLS